ncbi:MAG TPA: CRTAC1 family protein [Terriglobia bacterium]|nr:CRTAC1 family protein [Terriglobia bacterium]
MQLTRRKFMSSLGAAALPVGLQRAFSLPLNGPVIPGRFIDAARSLGVNFTHQSSPTSMKYLLESMGSGAALFDYDNDGRLDIFFANGALITDPMPRLAMPRKVSPAFWNRLFHQKSDGAFEDVTEKAGLCGTGYCTGVAVGDYDNDGYADLYVTAYGRNALYHNNGDGSFTDATELAGVAGEGWSTSAAWLDYDSDGRLDLIVTRYVRWDFSDVYCGRKLPGYRTYCYPDVFQPTTVLLYHNEGNGKFTEVSEKAGLTRKGNGLGVAVVDYDRDGRIDIFVANDSVAQSLYHNKGDGTFEETALVAGCGLDSNGNTFAGMGADFGDYNNDGWPDLIVTDLANQMYAFFSNSDGTFDYATTESGLGPITLRHSGWGVKFFDYDNDGWQDLIVAQGHVLDKVRLYYPELHYREPPLLVRNTGGRFVDVSAQSGAAFGKPQVGRGLAVGDINNDGKLDVVISANNGAACVLMNETPASNHWLSIKLRGMRSNRDGIGARIKVSTDAGDRFATVSTAGSYLSASDRRAHFGLGPSAEPVTVQVIWPSGCVQTVKRVAPDQEIEIREAEPGQS